MGWEGETLPSGCWVSVPKDLVWWLGGIWSYQGGPVLPVPTGTWWLAILGDTQPSRGTKPRWTQDTQDCRKDPTSIPSVTHTILPTPPAPRP